MIGEYGAPCAIRTPDLPVRSQWVDVSLQFLLKTKGKGVVPNGWTLGNRRVTSRKLPERLSAERVVRPD